MWISHRQSVLRRLVREKGETGKMDGLLPGLTPTCPTRRRQLPLPSLCGEAQQVTWVSSSAPWVLFSVSRVRQQRSSPVPSPPRGGLSPSLGFYTWKMGIKVPPCGVGTRIQCGNLPRSLALRLTFSRSQDGNSSCHKVAQVCGACIRVSGNPSSALTRGILNRRDSAS